jgi:hypothetical protein
MRRVRDVAQIGLVVLVQRRRHANNYRVHRRDLRIIGRRLEPVRFGRRDFFRRDAENISPAAGQRIHLALIDVEPGHGKLLLAIEQRQRQANVAQSDDADPGLARADARFQVGKQRRNNRVRRHMSRNNSSIAPRPDPPTIKVTHVIVAPRNRSPSETRVPCIVVPAMSFHTKVPPSIN